MRKLLRYLASAALVAGLVGTAAVASPSVVARINLSQQRMNVYVGGKHTYSWPVSTARGGYVTPTGSYQPQALARMHYSKKYHNSPMPHSVFFRGGYAIHGTYETGRLGRRASHGCIRLHPSNARELYRLIQSHGSGNTRITISY
jgi:lipoprotein-anchoring transpeptidase ErfK/SrfK